MAGYQDTNFRRNALLKIVENVIDRSIFRNEDYFPTYSPEQSPGGDRITWAIDYSTTDNGGFMSAFTDTYPAADTMASVNAYQTKDYAQATAQIFNILVNQVERNFDGKTTEGFTSYETKAIENAALNLKENLSGRFITDLTAMIDSGGNFSDAAISRATYGLASYEQAIAGALTLVAMENCQEALLSADYGNAMPQDLFWLMSGNQHTNLGRLTSGIAYSEFNASSAPGSLIDGDKTHRNRSFGGSEIIIDNAVGTGDIFLIRKGTIGVYNHQALGIEKIEVAAQQKMWGLSQGSNLVVTNPHWNGKLSGVTA